MAEVVADRPIQVLARSVEAGVRLLVQQGFESVARGHVVQHAHGEHVLIDRERDIAEHRSEFELARSDLVVACLQRDAEEPELLLEVAHEVEHAARDRAEVVVVEFLALVCLLYTSPSPRD